MKQQEKKNGEKKQLRSFIRYSGLGFQIAAIVGLGAWFGSWLDEKYPSNRNWYTLLFVLISVAMAMAYTIRQLNQMNK